MLQQWKNICLSSLQNNNFYLFFHDIMFANILLSGPCNARCPFCIGKLLDQKWNVHNLDIFPLIHIDDFLQILIDKKITEISLTWTNTDPLLYQHQKQLISYIRTCIPGVKISLHTNGRLLLQQKEIANAYDRISLSLPSFDEKTYQLMMWVPGVPDLKAILQYIHTPIKISCILTSENKDEVASFVQTCQTLGIKRLTFRMVYQDRTPRENYIHPEKLWRTFIRTFANNPVYDFKWLEITLWNFENSDISCVNLYSNGRISDKYLLNQP